jgi:hypothetical protein
VRPAKVLRQALKHVLERWKPAPPGGRDSSGPAGGGSSGSRLATQGAEAEAEARAAGGWVQGQLRGIRQDLTVQGLQGSVARRCYRACARVALTQADWAEFAVALGRLEELSRAVGASDDPDSSSPSSSSSSSSGGPGGRAPRLPAEFAAYRLLMTLGEGVRRQRLPTSSLIEQMRGLTAVTTPANQPASQPARPASSGSIYWSPPLSRACVHSTGCTCVCAGTAQGASRVPCTIVGEGYGWWPVAARSTSRQRRGGLVARLRE